MMTFLSVLLTIVLVLDCLILMLLVLIQLPTKEAGAGLAFGGGTTDALFGAGSGNTLTKITKWAAGIFFGLALMLSVLNTYASRPASELKNAVSKPPVTAPAAPPLNLPNSPATPAKPVTTGTNVEVSLLPPLSATNTPPANGAKATNVPASPAK